MILHELLQELHEYHPIGYMRSDTDVAIHCTLTSALFTNRGSQYILDRAHELFQNPVIVTFAPFFSASFVKRGILISVNHPPTVA